MNKFTFLLSLFYSPFDNPNNQYADYTSQNDKFGPFMANKSIATNTDVLQAGTSIVSKEIDEPKDQQIPKTVDLHIDVHANDKEDLVVENNNQKISGDTNLSYSPAVNTSDNVDDKHPSTHRQRKKMEDLKQFVSNTCKTEIQSELQNFKDELHKSMSEYTDNITKVLKSVDQPDEVKSSKISMLPPTYQQSMPSPNPCKPDVKLPTSFKYDQLPTDQPSDHQHTRYSNTTYQKHNSLSFMHNGYTWDLRDAAFLKDTGSLMIVNNDKDLVQFYKQLQSMAIMFNIFLQQFQTLQPWN
jgi:hypothetical protein